MKKIIIGFLIFILAGISNIQAIYVNPKLEKIYKEKVVLKIDKKYSDLEKRIKVLENLGEKIEKIKKLKKYKNNKKVISLLDQFLYLNKKQILRYKKRLILIKIDNKSKAPKKENVQEGKNENTNVEKTIENKKSDNIYENKYLEEIEKNKKIINSYSYSKYFSNKVYTNDLIFLENGVWYTYVYTTYTYFPDSTKIGLNDLKYNGIDPSKDILFVTNKKTLGILRNPTKKRLISDYIIKNVANKYYFLHELRDDVKKAPNINYDKNFLDLRSKTQGITYGLSQDSKIQNIYNFILKNTSYSKIVDFTNYKLFSGIETYINKDGVCIGYSRLMIYMLLFSGISDVEVIKGYVIDAQDFPEVGHAWVKIENKFYDPTFDDPVGIEDDREYKDYKYFALPKDLFYTNRYNEKDLPEYIKKLSLKDRRNIIMKNLYDVYSKYKNGNYNILKPIEFRLKHNIKYNEEINLDNFSKILDKKIVHNFAININGKTKYIKSFQYYPIDENTDFESILEQLNYNLTGFYFFEWYDENGNKSYRLAYNVSFR